MSWRKIVLIVLGGMVGLIVLAGAFLFIFLAGP